MANIAFHLDPKPLEKITTTLPKRHINPEKKMESSCAGGCEMNER
jgi:hypothetical protein